MNSSIQFKLLTWSGMDLENKLFHLVSFREGEEDSRSSVRLTPGAVPSVLGAECLHSLFVLFPSLGQGRKMREDYWKLLLENVSCCMFVSERYNPHYLIKVSEKKHTKPCVIHV